MGNPRVCYRIIWLSCEVNCHLHECADGYRHPRPSLAHVHSFHMLDISVLRDLLVVEIVVEVEPLTTLHAITITVVGSISLQHDFFLRLSALLTSA